MAFETSISSGEDFEPFDNEIERRTPEEFQTMVSTYQNCYDEDNSIESLFQTLEDCKIIDDNYISDMRTEVQELWGEQLISPETTNEEILQMVFEFPIFKRVQERNPKAASFISYTLCEYYVKNPKDPGHDISHIFGMLYDYTRFQEIYGLWQSDVFAQIDEIKLLMEVTCHDLFTVGVSKSNPAQSFYAWVKDGPGSAEVVRSELIPAYLRDKIGIHNHLDWEKISDEKLETYFGIDRETFEEILLAVETHSPKRNHKIDGPVQDLTSMMLYLLDTFSLNHPDRENQLIGENSKKISLLTKFFVNPILNKFTSRIASGLINILYTNSEPILCKELEFLRVDYNKRLNLTIKIANSFFKGLGLDTSRIKNPYNKPMDDVSSQELLDELATKLVQ